MQIRQKYVYGDGRRLDGQRFAESQLARATGVNQSNLVKFFHFEIPFPDFLSFSLSVSIRNYTIITGIGYVHKIE